MHHTKEIKRPDGKRIELRVSFACDFLNKHRWGFEVRICQPRKRTFYDAVDTDDYSYRKLDLPDRYKYKVAETLKHVTAAEIYDAQLELWHKIKPQILISDNEQ